MNGNNSLQSWPRSLSLFNVARFLIHNCTQVDSQHLVPNSSLGGGLYCKQSVTIFEVMHSEQQPI